jgi:hypothetical protein
MAQEATIRVQQPQSSAARVSETQSRDVSDMLVRNPAPDGTPSREPTGVYRIVPPKK